jgi:hypothetical protein
MDIFSLSLFVYYHKEFLFTDHVHVVYDHYWELTARDGERYITKGNNTATAMPENVQIRITNLFNGNKLLGKSQNT